MIQLSVKEAMVLLSDTNNAINEVVRSMNGIGSLSYNISREIQGENQVKQVLESLEKKAFLIQDNFRESSEKLNEFASSQFDRYIESGKKILAKINSIWEETERISSEIYDTDILGDEFVNLSHYFNQNVGNAEVNFIKDSSGQSQKVVM